MLLCEFSLSGLWTWITTNKEWLFSGFGLVIVLAVFSFIKNWFTKRKNIPRTSKQSAQFFTNKSSTRILFIDDDTSFKVVEILKTAGWTNTRIKEDVSALNDPDLFDADIVFVDIQGVGKALGFKEDGLGLTKAIKEKYPQKHVVVYSAETRGNRFHDGLKAADDFLSKTAQPYEFQKIVEDYVQGQSK